MEHMPSNKLKQDSTQQPGDAIPWSKLTYRQKAQFFLHSTRFPDAETYLQEFTSWEQPDISNEHKVDTS